MPADIRVPGFTARFSRWSILLFLFPTVSFAAGANLRIVVLEGDGAINNVRAHTAHDPVVEVRDQQDGLVAGATVNFQTPATGASAEFADGMRSFIAQTDSDGRAAAHGLRPNSIIGPYEIRVTASYQSQSASAVIMQTNASPAEAKSSKKKWLIVLVAGAAAGGAGAFAATRGGKSSSSASSANSSSQTGSTGTIVPGSPSFGPPQ